MVLQGPTIIKARTKGSSIRTALPNTHKGTYYRAAAMVLHCPTPVRAHTHGNSIGIALPDTLKVTHHSHRVAALVLHCRGFFPRPQFTSLVGCCLALLRAYIIGVAIASPFPDTTWWAVSSVVWYGATVRCGTIMLGCPVSASDNSLVLLAMFLVWCPLSRLSLSGPSLNG